MIPQQKLVPLREIAEAYGVHHKTVRKWIAQGRVPAYRVAGHTLRLDPDEVRKALLSPTTNAVHPARATAERKASAPAPVTLAERRARMQASARRRSKKSGA